MTKHDATLQAEKNAKHLKRSLGDDSNNWSFYYLNPHSERWESSQPNTFHVAVKLRRYYLINAARQLLGREPFTQAETDEMSAKKWQYYV